MSPKSQTNHSISLLSLILAKCHIVKNFLLLHRIPLTNPNIAFLKLTEKVTFPVFPQPTDFPFCTVTSVICFLIEFCKPGDISL